MGCPKPLLYMGGETFLTRIIRLYRSQVDAVVVVLGADSARIESAIPLDSTHVLYNRRPQDGPLSSLKLALKEVREASGLILHPVDHPLVGEATIVRLLRAHRARPDCILAPRFRGFNGHPVLFPSKFFPELEKAPLETGARAVTRGHRACVLAVPTDDPGIHINIDTPEEYWRRFGFPPLDRRVLQGPQPSPPCLVNK